MDGGFKYVWDLPLSQANGTISCICLTNVLAGRGCKYGANYFVRLKGDTPISGEINNNSYRHNHRTFIADGYRLEMIAVRNSTSVNLRKVPEDYIHARLMVRTYTQMATAAIEETNIEMHHYPYWTHYTGGGSKDDTDAPYWNDENRMDYLFTLRMATGTALPEKKSAPTLACDTVLKYTTAPALSGIWIRSVVTDARPKGSSCLPTLLTFPISA